MPGLADELGDWQIYCLDNAIGYFVTVTKNALAETEKVGVKPDFEYVAKYTLDQLLDDDFRLPRPPTKSPAAKGKGIGQHVKMMFAVGAPQGRGTKKGKGGKASKQPPVPLLVQKWLAKKGLV